MEQPGFQQTDFRETLYLKFFFFEFVEKIQVLLKSEENTGALREFLCTFVTISLLILLRLRNVLDKMCR
jgi:hypothetical protein